MHANVADTGESIPRCSYHVVLSDPCARKWPILMLPCRERGPVGALEKAKGNIGALSAYLRHRIILLISKSWQGLPKLGKKAVGILLLQKKKDAKETT